MLRLFLPGEIKLCKIDFMRSKYTSTFKLPIFVPEPSFIRKISYHSKVISQGNFSLDFLVSTNNGISYSSLMNIIVEAGVGERVFLPAILIPENSLLRVVYLKGTSEVSDIQLSFEVNSLCVI